MLYLESRKDFPIPSSTYLSHSSPSMEYCLPRASSIIASDLRSSFSAIRLILPLDGPFSSLRIEHRGWIVHSDISPWRYTNWSP